VLDQPVSEVAVLLFALARLGTTNLQSDHANPENKNNVKKNEK
jgi:hypothetical protein